MNSSTEKLRKWAELLLDTGKRNNLIHFRDGRYGSIEVVAPSFDDFFGHVDRVSMFEVFNPKLETEEDAEAQEMSREEYIETFSGKLKRNQILIYNDKNAPLNAVRTLGKNIRTVTEETGVNIGYLAFGFVRWNEKGSKTVMKAPILLVPIAVLNESFVDPIYIKTSGDEIVVNPTFNYKLQSDFDVRLPEYDEEEGISRYWEKVDELCKKLDWTTEKTCRMGVFSFMKINMYRDLKDNEDVILRNPNILALLGEAAGSAAVEETITDGNDVHNVVDADASQEEAVMMAKEGRSFVLQGPPGTGKSQTITNIIAESLYDGKKVLFVSEKSAALNVVYKKLKDAGLEDFCLELHSHKANKKSVVEELCRTLKADKTAVSDQAGKEVRQKVEAQRDLDFYVQEVHKTQPVILRSFYRLQEEQSAVREAPDLEYVIENICEKGEEYLTASETDIRRFLGYLPVVGYDYTSYIWYGYEKSGLTYEETLRIKKDLQSVSEMARQAQSVDETATNRYRIGVENIRLSDRLSEFFAAAKDSDFFTPSFFSSDLQALRAKATKLQAIASEAVAARDALLAVCEREVFHIDGEKLYSDLVKKYGGMFSRLFSRAYKKEIAELRFCTKDGKKMKYDAALQTAKLLRTYQNLYKEFLSEESEVSAVSGNGYKGLDTDFARLIADTDAAIAWKGCGTGFGRLTELSADEYVKEKAMFGEIAQRLSNTFARYREAANRLSAQFNRAECDILALPLQALIEKCEGCFDSLNRLDNWCEFKKLLDKVGQNGLRDYLDFCIEKRLETKYFLPCYKKIFFRQWEDAIVHGSAFLTELSRVPHDERVKIFKEKDEILFGIAQALIKEKLSAERPDLDLVAAGSSVAMLLREGEKKRCQKGIRQLFSEMKDLIQTLKPCLLMSPLSVSTYLGKEMTFDVVVFDEASQIFPQDAVGAIYRGKQLIVVGDTRQMPPSNFFTAVENEDTDEDGEDIAGFESVLDLCAASFPQKRLKWHYRSRYEPLIAFSNKNFYDGELVTFPSSRRDEKGIGVDYYYVDGRFDRKSKTNRQEAERVAELVFENFEKYPERSVGVVAFSIAQQNLIDRLLQKKRRIDRSKEEFFKSDRPEPFFVKNLETVQGDERDTVIFSIAYAKDEAGKLLLNFGPLNKAGGERRLNVAVTRAKINVAVVSSMHGCDIDLNRTKSRGTQLLRDYLDYAEHGAETLEGGGKGTFERFDSAFREEVAEFLQENGIETEKEVGESSVKIDIAVKNPKTGNYVLAIECDGFGYLASKNTRDRDRLRAAVLERMGWRYYRLWSTDWFRNKGVEGDLLLQACRQALASPKDGNRKSVSEPVVYGTDFEEKTEGTHFSFPIYETADIIGLAKRYGKHFLLFLEKVLEKEAPLSEEWFLKRTVFLFDGREKVTVAVKARYEEMTRGCERNGIERKDGFLGLTGHDIPMMRVPKDGEPPRELKYIDLRELAKGMHEIIRKNVVCDKNGLFKTIVEKLGLSRVTDAAEARLEEALDLLSPYIVVEGNNLFLR